MRKLATLTAVALLWGTASFATGYGDVITQAFAAAGYSNIQVAPSGSDWVVTAEMNGTVQHFTVDPSTGRSRHDDGVGHHSSGDDNGHHSAGHDLNDDNGHHSAGHDQGDDHGNHSVGHDAGDDHGHDGAGHDAGDDHGKHGSDHD